MRHDRRENSLFCSKRPGPSGQQGLGVRIIRALLESAGAKRPALDSASSRRATAHPERGNFEPSGCTASPVDQKCLPRRRLEGQRVRYVFEEEMYGQVWQKCRKKRQERHAAEKARHAAFGQRWKRRPGEEQKTGHCDRAVGSQKKGCQGSQKEIGSPPVLRAAAAWFRALPVVSEHHSDGRLVLLASLRLRTSRLAHTGCIE